MRKNKKLIAILTLVIFAMTLVPFAAMAANADVKADASTFATDKANATFEVGDTTKVKAVVQLNDAAGKLVDDATNQIIVWAESTANQQSSALTVTGADATRFGTAGYWTVDATAGLAELELDFAREGTYTLKAALAEKNIAPDLTPEDLVALGDLVAPGDLVDKLTVPADYSKVVVTKKAAATDKYTISIDDSANLEDIDANGVESKTAVFTVKDADNLAVKNTVVTVESNSGSVTFDKAEYTTNYKGEITVKVKGTVEGEYKVYVKAGDTEQEFTATVTANYPADIQVSKKPDNKLALNTKRDDLKDSLQFTVTDNNGNLITAVGSLGKTANNNGGKGDYITVTAPDGSSLKSKELKLVAEDNHFYIDLNGKNLDKEGTYTFTVYLENGKKAVASVEVAKFGTAKKLVVDYKAEVAEIGSSVVAPEVYFLDENGVKKGAKDTEYTLGYNGYAAIWDTANDGSFKVKDDPAYIGTTVKVTAVAERQGLTAVDTILIGEGGTAMTFNDTKGAVDTNNREEFQVVDEKGNKVAINADIKAVNILLSNQSNPDAKVSATNVGADADLAKEGLGKISLTSDKQTTVDVSVIVKDENGRLYAGNMTYTFGPSSSVDGQIVVMTIGSQDTIVNNNIVKIDAAPMVNADWRTMVPFRALAENFGATVEWNETDKTVTATLDGVTVVMTIDSTEYTVNGEKKTMDTKPVIVDGRTMVPVRFAAEAFGFKATPTFAADGTTASVAFMR